MRIDCSFGYVIKDLLTDSKNATFGTCIIWWKSDKIQFNNYCTVLKILNCLNFKVFQTILFVFQND